MPRSNNGFTLIELLITISIIAILSAIGLVIYSTVMSQGRDSKRQSDLRSLQSSLEQYYADQGFYPTQNGLDILVLNQSPPLPAFTNCTGSPTPCTVSKTYQNNPPQDPTETDRYRYEATPPTPCNNSTTKCTSYCLYASLENPPSPAPPAPTGCTYPTIDYNFALTPP